MVRRQPSPLPKIWLISDARNDTRLERLLDSLPRGSGFIYRHYHLEAEERRARFDVLARIARRRGHVVILSGGARQARQWRADGAYGAYDTYGAYGAYAAYVAYGAPAKAGASGPGQVARGGRRSPPSRGRGLRLATAHSLREIGRARRAKADAILLSPVFPTRSHPGARALGPVRFRLLAARAGRPVIALGGMTSRRARRTGPAGWAAIDGICAEAHHPIPVDS